MPAAPHTPPPTPLLRLCPKHGIVAGPDGQCVICHRGSDARGAQGGAARLVAGLAVIVLLVAGVVVWKASTRRAPAEARAEVRQEAPVPVAAAPAAPATLGEAPDEGLEERQAAGRATENERLNDEIEAEIHRVPIRLYVDDKCDLCGLARDFLKREGLNYTEVDVGASPSALEELHEEEPQTDGALARRGRRAARGLRAGAGARGGEARRRPARQVSSGSAASARAGRAAGEALGAPQRTLPVSCIRRKSVSTERTVTARPVNPSQKCASEKPMR